MRRRHGDARPVGRNPELASIVAAEWEASIEVVGSAGSKRSVLIPRETNGTHGFPANLIETRENGVILRAFGPACRLAHHPGTDFRLPASRISSVAPRTTSLSRPRPRHMTVPPGSFARVRMPTSTAILMRCREDFPAERERPAGSGTRRRTSRSAVRGRACHACARVPARMVAEALSHPSGPE